MSFAEIAAGPDVVSANIDLSCDLYSVPVGVFGKSHVEGEKKAMAEWAGNVTVEWSRFGNAIAGPDIRTTMSEAGCPSLPRSHYKITGIMDLGKTIFATLQISETSHCAAMHGSPASVQSSICAVKQFNPSAPAFRAFLIS